MKNVIYKILPIIIICLLGVLIYSNTFDNPFQFDDRGFIIKNPDIRSFSTVVSSRWGKPSRVIGFLSFALNYHFNKLNVFGYHVFNLIIHLIASLFVFWFSKLILSTPKLDFKDIGDKKGLFAFLAALLFVSHPIQTEAVTYVCQRFASLATLFYLASLCFYIKARLKMVEGNRGKSLVVPFLLSAVFALCSMFTKEISFTLPFSILLIEFFFIYPEGLNLKNNKKVTAVLLLFIFLFVLVVPAQFYFKAKNILFAESVSGSHDGDYINTWQYFITQFRVITTYVRLLFLPVNQTLDYDFPASKSLFETSTMLSFLFLLLLLSIAVKLYRKNRLFSFTIFWFFLTLSVESSFILIRHVIFEHRLYLPSVGFCILIPALIYKITKDYKRAFAVIIFIVLILSALTYQRNKVWDSDVLLWEDAVKKAPNKARTYINLCGAQFKEGKHEQALINCNKALELNPKSFMGRNNRGLIYSATGEYDLAISDFNDALEIEGKSEEAVNNRGNVYAKQGKYDKAIEDFTKAIEVNPELDTGYNNRAFVNILKNDLPQALEDINKAIVMNSSLAEGYHNRALIYRKRNKEDLALIDLNRALMLKPFYVNAHYLTGEIFEKKGELDRAIESYGKVIMADDQHFKAYMNRGGLYFHKGFYEKALSDFNVAERINPEHVDIYYNRANVYSAFKEYDKAIKDYTRALEIYPEHMQAYNNRGNIYRKLRKYDLAISDFNKSLELNPEIGLVYYNRAMAYGSLEKYKKSYDDLIKAKSLKYPVSDKVIDVIRNKINE